MKKVSLTGVYFSFVVTFTFQLNSWEASGQAVVPGVLSSLPDVCLRGTLESYNGIALSTLLTAMQCSIPVSWFCDRIACISIR